MLMMGALIVLCVAIIIVASFHAVWLVKLAYSGLNNTPKPAPPFSKKRSKSS